MAWGSEIRLASSKHGQSREVDELPTPNCCHGAKRRSCSSLTELETDLKPPSLQFLEVKRETPPRLRTAVSVQRYPELLKLMRQPTTHRQSNETSCLVHKPTRYRPTPIKARAISKTKRNPAPKSKSQACPRVHVSGISYLSERFIRGIAFPKPTNIVGPGGMMLARPSSTKDEPG